MHGKERALLLAAADPLPAQGLGSVWGGGYRFAIMLQQVPWVEREHFYQLSDWGMSREGAPPHYASYTC